MKYSYGIMIFLACSSFCQGQSQNNFRNFANRSDSLMRIAYEKRDDLAYDRLMKEFTIKYRQLDSVDRKKYSRQYANALYDFACLYSLINEKKKAIEVLSLSIKAGYADYLHIQVDQDFDPIRSEPAFKDLLEPLRAVSDYLYILKRSAAYDTIQKRELPKFSYQS